MYVDDIIFGSTNDSLCEGFANVMQCEFEMSMMGELNFFLGLQIKQVEGGTFVSQTKYCRQVLNKFGMDNCKEAITPMATSCYLDKDEYGEEVNQTMFRGMIGSLLYLTDSRPDIMHNVCVCARYQANPKESHLTTVKRILKYLKGTTSFGLWYPSDATPSLIGYSDADYGACKIDRKSTSGGNAKTMMRTKAAEARFLGCRSGDGLMRRDFDGGFACGAWLRRGSDRRRRTRVYGGEIHPVVASRERWNGVMKMISEEAARCPARRCRDWVSRMEKMKMTVAVEEACVNEGEALWWRLR
ncbi:uncharacterized mitochondrial protein AtMg00810-like [Vigna angularis]|uniref:uncharacterized mitochondrial protein AtMg00810-like n=1 Tax=Phaseolus angularis TaxID=3914 RepID=UPI00080A1A58|nr:uncharacterized mitochondrial protein AtMg00810-like [Vigna angularis]